MTDMIPLTMKYKVGDEVYAKVRITDSMLDSDGAIERYTYCGSKFWCEPDDIYEPPTPIVWQDGALEFPLIDYNKLTVTVCKTSGVITCWTANELEQMENGDLDSMRWAQFPMPKLPEIQIEPCPFFDCGSGCEVEEAGFGDLGEITKYYVRCSTEDCNYMSRAYFTKQEAIDAHNILCRRMK